MREVTAGWVEDAVLAAHIEIGPHSLLADEPFENGGGDTGPTSHQLLLSALGACTTLTLRLYAKRKGWPLTDANVRLTARQENGRYVITRQLHFEGELDPVQRTRLMEIANRCPVHRTLTGEITIDTIEASES
ncbi:MAG: OsmC family protein [Vicinamibacterales bacterium]